MGQKDDRYRTLFEFANDAHFLMRDGVFIDVNRRVAEIFGRPAADLIGLSPWEVSPQSQADGRDSREKAEEKLRKALAGTPQIFEWTHVREDGSAVQVEVSLTRIDLEDGPAVFAVLRDLTERVVAQEAIRKSREQLKLLADLLPAMVARLDSDLRFTFVNRNARDFLERTESEILEVSLGDLLDADIHRAVTPSVEGALRGVADEIEVSVPFPDGSRRVLSASCVPEFSMNGDVTGVVALVLDVTENRMAQARIRESESRFRALFRSTPLAVLNTDLQGVILSCNLAFTKMHETVEGPSEQVGRHASDFVHEKDLGVLEANLRRAVESGGPVGPEVFTLLKENGFPFPAEIRSMAIRDEEGRPLSIVAHAVDITDRLEIEAQERRAKEDLRALSQRLEEVREEERLSLSRELHDELGQALTTILIDLAALRKKLEAGEPGAVEDVVALGEGAEKTLTAVRGLAARLRPPVLDVLGLGAALQWQAEEMARRTSMDFIVDVPEDSLDLPIELSTAVFRIAQEALTNVVRHSFASRVHIIMKALISELSLIVQDDGVGIDSERLAGSGSLGLVGMRERAAALGGRLTVEPGADRGTRVLLSVPFESREVARSTRR